jgi:hypothetical protein
MASSHLRIAWQRRGAIRPTISRSAEYAGRFLLGAHNVGQGWSDFSGRVWREGVMTLYHQNAASTGKCSLEISRKTATLCNLCPGSHHSSGRWRPLTTTRTGFGFVQEQYGRNTRFGCVFFGSSRLAIHWVISSKRSGIGGQHVARLSLLSIPPRMCINSLWRVRLRRIPVFSLPA